MNKTQNTKHKARNIRKTVKSWFVPGIFIFLFVYFLVNMVSTQLISPLYFKLINGDKIAAGIYLKNLLGSQSFLSELTKFKAVFGSDLVNNVYQEKIKREEKIKSLEQILVNNPKERDALYNLSLLYKEAGDNEKADYYLAKAKEVDPDIK